MEPSDRDGMVLVGTVLGTGGMGGLGCATAILLGGMDEDELTGAAPAKPLTAFRAVMDRAG